MAPRNTVEISAPRRNVTVLGAFNPAILTPTWVAKHIPVPGPQIEQLVGEEDGEVLFRSGNDLLWRLNSSRLVVFGDESITGEFVAAVARVLPHTPFTAVGVNIQLTGNIDLASREEWNLRLNRDLAEDLLGGSTSEISLSHVVAREDGVRLTLRLSFPSAGQAAVLDFNYHQHLSTVAQVSEDGAAIVVAHALRATEFAKDAARISENLLGG